MNDHETGFEHGYTQALADVRVVVGEFFSKFVRGGPRAAIWSLASADLLARINTLEREEQHESVQPPPLR